MAKTKDFDRSKFKGATVAANKASANDAEKATSSQREGRAGYLTIGEGKTILRLAPPHNADSPALEPICKAWLPREVKDKDDNVIVKNMPILNSRVHSPITKDIVDEYINFITKLMYKEHSKDEAKKKLALVNGYKDKTGKWISGIRPNLGFVGYGWIGDEFGRVELSKTVVDRMNELAIDEEAEETIATDPFSDPDTGVSVILEYDKGAESGKKWKVNRGTKARPLTNEQLMKLDEAESLDSMFRNSYTKDDFNNALAGLAMFDEKAGYGVMDMQEFIDICEEVSDMVNSCPEIKESNKKDSDEDDVKSVAKSIPAKSVKTVTKKVVPTIEDEEEEEVEASTKRTDAEEALFGEDDGLDDLDIEELKEFAKDNKLSVVVKLAYPKAKVVAMIREAIKVKKSGVTNDLPFDAPSSPSGTASSRLAELRAKSKKK